MIAGDFNINWLDASDTERTKFYELFETFNLLQLVKEPTRKDRLLDYIVCSDNIFYKVINSDYIN